MRSIQITVFISFIIAASLSAQDKWEILSEGTGNTKAFDFINKDTGWIAGDRGIIRTNDGGETWVPIFNGERAFGDIDFINDSIGWAIEGTLHFDRPPHNILKTLDGGESWFVQKKVEDKVDWDRIDLVVISENVVYAVGQDSIRKTKDGGSSWENITPASGSWFHRASFFNGDIGVVLGDDNLLFKTSDGGKTWYTSTLPEFNNLYKIQFINDSTCYFLTGWEGKIYKTTDFFNSWSVLYQTNHEIQSFHFYNNDTAIALIDSSSSTKILKSTDGGITWNPTEHMPLRQGSIMSYNIYANQNVTFVFGSSWGAQVSLLLKSIDQGNTWTLKKRLLPFNDVHFINRDTGILAGGTSGIHYCWGLLLFTQDGGKTWNSLLNPETNPTEFYFINEEKAYVTTLGMNNSPGSTYSSLDGGYSWKVDTMIFESYNICFFLNDSVGWDIVGGWGPGGIGTYKTIDGGQTWKEFLNLGGLLGLDEYFNSLFFTDENTGYFIGDGGAIIKFSGQGELQKEESGTTLPLKGIDFIDNEVGWIRGGYRNDDGFGSVFLRTEDGGENWTEIPVLNFLINDFYFENRHHGWAVGEDNKGRGMILESFDSGLSWEVAIDSLSGSLNSLHFKDGFGWAVGDNGLILKTEYTSTTGMGHDYLLEEKDEIHLKNYPNPFPSRTRISYQLPSSGFVELSIYDLSGRKEATLVNESQAAGSHEIEWIAKGMQPGIYFCELKTSMGRQVIKMILIK